MEITSSYSAEIKRKGLPLRQTIQIYREAVCFLSEVFFSEWGGLSQIADATFRFNAAEHLVHETKKNHAKYDFDSRYPKMPSYLRRSAITHALGNVSSYMTRMEQWKESGKKKGMPVFSSGNRAMPVFYREGMYREAGEDRAVLKLYDGHDWKWFEAGLVHTDMEYLRKNWAGKKASAPVLEKKNKRYYLRFSYTETVTLSKTKIKDQIICSVDLGINTDAVCTILGADGTVTGRKFINFPVEKDRLYRVLGRIRRFQREHGCANVGGLWDYAKRFNEELSRKIAKAIAEYARENEADVIVFEYLDRKGRIHGKKKQKLHMWRKRTIQKMCEHKAHRMGIRISHVCAWNTSKLAFDGSGEVTRDSGNHSLCTFQQEDAQKKAKQYNCDLSASYNIGARYFIRELQKPLSETARSSLEAKVPAVKRRSSCVYADLIHMSRELGIRKDA